MITTATYYCSARSAAALVSWVSGTDASLLPFGLDYTTNCLRCNYDLRAAFASIVCWYKALCVVIFVEQPLNAFEVTKGAKLPTHYRRAFAAA